METGILKMIVNLDKFNLKLDKLASIDTIQKGLRNACALVEGEAKKNCPQGSTGTLWRSIHSRVEGLVGEVYSDAEYAIYVHQGTGKYAKDGNGRPGWWVFVKGESTDPSKKSNNRKIYTAEQAFWIKDRLVESGIPEEDIWVTQGQQPNPFLERALDQNKQEIQQAFDKAIKEAVK